MKEIWKDGWINEGEKEKGTKERKNMIKRIKKQTKKTEMATFWLSVIFYKWQNGQTNEIT